MIEPLRGREIPYGERVRVYWNLHRKCWSIRYRGLVVGHANSLVLTGVRGVVSAAGRERVRRERKKNVHAFLEGNLLHDGSGDYRTAVVLSGKLITYNPYTMDGFHWSDLEGLRPVEYSMDLAWMTTTDRGRKPLTKGLQVYTASTRANTTNQYTDTAR